MTTKKSFLGGKFPPVIADAIKDKAKSLGVSVNELLEGIFMKVLDKDSDNQLTKEEFFQYFNDNVREVIREELESFGNIQQDNTEVDTIGSSDEDNENEEEPEAVSHIEPYEAPESWWAFEQLPNRFKDELNCHILSHWEYRLNSVLDFEEIELHDFLSSLADKTVQEAIEPPKYDCNDMEFYRILPEELATIVDSVLQDAIEENGESYNKGNFYRIFAKLLIAKSNEIFVKARTFEISFSRREYVYLEKLMAYVNRSRKQKFKSLKQWMLYRLGDYLNDLGSWASLNDKDMKELGKEFMEKAVNG